MSSEQQYVSVEEFIQMHADRLGQDRLDTEDKLLHSLVGPMHSIGTVRTVAGVIGEYNNFIPNEVVDTLADSWDMIGWVSLGYDHSPVLFVMMKEEVPERFVPEFWLRLGADETDFIMSRSLIRFWWD